MSAALSAPPTDPVARLAPPARWRGGWAALALTALARVVLSTLASLVVCSLVPALFGWHPTVVMTGSMEPRLHPGDVVVSRPIASSQLRIGQVLLVADPDHAGRERLHRLAVFNADGTLTLRGDANAANDSSPVARSAVHGVGALRAPFIGLPKLWLSEGDYTALVELAVALAVLGVAALAYRADDDRADDEFDAIAAEAATTAVARTPSSRLVRAGAACVIAAGLIGVGLPAAAPARAATRFAATTSNPTDSWAAAAYFTCKAASLAPSPYLYYQLGETSGTTATDTSGNSRNGTYQGGFTRRVTGSCSRDNSAAVTLDGSSSVISTPTQVANPTVFSIGIWFKTTSTTGGRLIGFGDSQTGTSTNDDRQLYLANNGQVVFGVRPNSAKTIVSPKSYNDGAWHLADATLSSTGMQLYVDGHLVASKASVTTAQNYTGYWRIGYDTLASSGSAPTSNYLAASVDDAAVYTSALTAAQIAAVYAAA
ncbi:MAG: LamG-like jellyroll fold domain-containing protein [Jatrophihabitantaceae bacterium]